MIIYKKGWLYNEPFFWRISPEDCRVYLDNTINDLSSVEN